MSERLGNLGYMGMALEVTKGVPLSPTDYGMFFDETMTTNRNLQIQDPVFGNKFGTYQVLPGERDHQGVITVVAEPNTVAKYFDMLLTRGSVTSSYTFTVTSANATIGATYTNNGVTFTVVATIASSTTLLMTGSGAPTASGTLTKASGTGDTTITFSTAVNTTNSWPYTLGTTNPKSYTLDLSYGNIVKRFFGVELSKITPSWNKNELQLKLTVSALGSFLGREIASVSTNVVALKTDYDPNPTNGLVTNDLVRIWHAADGTTQDFTITSFTSTTITLSGSPTSITSGDMIYLRPATPAINMLPPFLWTNTQFCYGTTAAAALSAAQTRLEQSSTWEIMHDFEKPAGADRSGSQDPAALVRLTGDISHTAKKFFDSPADIEAYNNLAKGAVVIRHFVYSGGNTYELRITINHLVTNDPIAQMKSKAVSYSTIKYLAQYESTDGQAFDVKVINNLSAIS